LLFHRREGGRLSNPIEISSKSTKIYHKHINIIIDRMAMNLVKEVLVEGARIGEGCVALLLELDFLLFEKGDSGARLLRCCLQNLIAEYNINNI